VEGASRRLIFAGLKPCASTEPYLCGVIPSGARDLSWFGVGAMKIEERFLDESPRLD
jgi:hypothetical protein